MCAVLDHIVQDLEVQANGDHYVVSGHLHFVVPVNQAEAPHQLEREVDRIGQVIKRQIYQDLLQTVEGQIVEQWQLANPDLQKRGQRPFTFITSFGRIVVLRTRFMNRWDKTWQVPSAVVWQTPHRQCIVQGLRDAVCDQMRDRSVRKSQAALSAQADTAQLLANSSVLKVVHQEGDRLVQARREQSETILKEYPKAAEIGLAATEEQEQQQEQVQDQEDQETPTGEAKAVSSSEAESSSDENEDAEVKLTPEEEKEALAEAQAFLRPVGFAAGEETMDPAFEGPRRVDDNFVLFQPDEVKTKAQDCCEGEENWTYTGTVLTKQLTRFLVAGSAVLLWRQAAALLCCAGVLSKKVGLLVIADGAGWIRRWFEALDLPGKVMILCWYHLGKRLYQGLSSAGFGKERRKELEKEVLNHLWHGRKEQAIWVLWGAREEARSPEKISELIGYLLRRRDYLPNYANRYAAGLWITSNRVEKWNDWAVSDRCKRRGMCWTPEGVLALAELQAARFNQEMDTWRGSGQLPELPRVPQADQQPEQPVDETPSFTQAA